MLIETIEGDRRSKTMLEQSSGSLPNREAIIILLMFQSAF
jgi:hypothetical protein